MNVLIACEESQEVCQAFYERGHDAWSCDLQEASGELPERHIQDDCLKIARLHKWDLLIAHPPCQYLANSGVSHLYKNCHRWPKLFEGADFFRALLDMPNIPKKCIENPVMHKYALRLIGRKHDQIIQPHEFGHLEKKGTCFWLEGIDPLITQTNLKWQTNQLPKSEGSRIHWMSPSEDRAKERAKSYRGVAQRMAEQWGSDVQTRLF